MTSRVLNYPLKLLVLSGMYLPNKKRKLKIFYKIFQFIFFTTKLIMSINELYYLSNEFIKVNSNKLIIIRFILITFAQLLILFKYVNIILSKKKLLKLISFLSFNDLISMNNQEIEIERRCELKIRYYYY